MGIMKFLANGFRAYGMAWKSFLIHSVIYTIATQIFNPGFGILPNILSLEDATPPTTLGGICIFILLTFTTLAFTLNAHRSTEGKKIGFIESYALALRLYGRYFFAVSLFFVGLSIVSIPLNLWLEYYIPDSSDSIVMSSFIQLFGVLILIIPMINWSSRYAFTPYAAIIEDRDIKGAFTRSDYLTKNKVFGVAFRESWVGFCFFIAIVIPLVLIGWFITYILLKLGISYFTALGAAYTFAETIWVGLFIVFNVLYLKSLALEDTLAKAKDKSPPEKKESSSKFHPAVILFPVIDIIGKLYVPLLKAIFEKLKPRLKSFFEQNGKFSKDVEEDKFPKKEDVPEYFDDEELKDRQLKKVKKVKKKKVPDKKTIKTVQYFEDDG
ncbi:MAG: hypothetical protein JSV88_31530 [Candidatus Aminicenantes bacterium]|nr:MAG: hypothetical protein JSV88_31530 [Candidatus Aminicenantes bacterium]